MEWKWLYECSQNWKVKNKVRKNYQYDDCLLYFYIKEEKRKNMFMSVYTPATNEGGKEVKDNRQKWNC